MNENYHPEALMLTGRQIRKLLGGISLTCWYKLCKKGVFSHARLGPASNRLYPMSQVTALIESAQRKAQQENK